MFHFFKNYSLRPQYLLGSSSGTGEEAKAPTLTEFTFYYERQIINMYMDIPYNFKYLKIS